MEKRDTLLRYTKPTKLTGDNGLHLLVNPSGSSLWRYKDRIAAKAVTWSRQPN